MKIIALCLICAGATAIAAATDSFTDALAGGKVSLNVRLRYEGVSQTGLQDAEAATVRARLGFTTAPLVGWSAMLEAENITAFDGDRYSQAGLNPGGAGRAVVADPTGTEFNQAWLALARGKTTATAGRQRLVLDNARFIGDSGWRQNMQTFDAVTVQDKSLEKTTLTYAYLDRINRVFGDRHPQGYWRSESHVFNASYAGFGAGTLTGYAYLLDFANAATSSCATYGASFAGARPFGGGKFNYRAEVATQSNYGASPLDYTTRYCVLEAGPAFKSGSLTLGHEVLGSDNNTGFKTPLATLHAFNGWADLFLTTPAAGLRDTYARVNATLPGKAALIARYHWFATDRGGAALGRELDVQLSQPLGAGFTVLVKYARFDRKSTAFPDVEKIWAQVEFSR